MQLLPTDHSLSHLVHSQLSYPDGQNLSLQRYETITTISKPGSRTSIRPGDGQIGKLTQELWNSERKGQIKWMCLLFGEFLFGWSLKPKGSYPFEGPLLSTQTQRTSGMLGCSPRNPSPARWKSVFRRPCDPWLVGNNKVI